MVAMYKDLKLGQLQKTHRKAKQEGYPVGIHQSQTHFPLVTRLLAAARENRSYYRMKTNICEI